MLPVSSGDRPTVRPDDPHALADLVHTPTWKWVVNVYKTRGLSVDVVDEHLNVLASPGTSEAHLPIDPNVIEAVGHLAVALNNGHGDTTSAGSRRFCCMPFVASGTLAGAALVGGDRERNRDDELQHAAALLSRVLEDCLSSTGGPRATSRRVEALRDLLDNARGKASDRAVFLAFAEIMSVWDEAELVGYREDLVGRFVLSASLPGTDRSIVPDVIAGDALPKGQVISLTAPMQRQLGFGDTRFPIAVRLSTSGGGWLVAATHRPGTRQLPEWFDFYISALTEALNGSLESELAQVTWTIMEHLTEGDSAREALTRAVAAAARMLYAESSFTVWEPDGAVVLSMGQTVEGSTGDAHRADVFRVALEAPTGSHAVLELKPIGSRSFTMRDLQVFEAAASTLSRWFATSADELANRREPAASRQSFDEVVERCIATRKRSSSSALILIMPNAADSMDVTYEWIRRLRSQLRPTDLAGCLTTGEIAVVALETSAMDALVVARRIARVVNSSVDPVHQRVRVGMAAVGAAASAHSAIAEARRHVIEA